MIRRAIGVGGVALLLALASTAADAGEVPAGPRLATVRLQFFYPPTIELLTIDGKGGTPIELVGGGERAAVLPFPLTSPSWSPDGSSMAFSGWVDALGERTKVFVVSADGSGLRALPGTIDGYAPVFAADGHTIAFARARGASALASAAARRALPPSGTSLWTVDLATGQPRQLTPWSDEVELVPSSYSPDGTTLLVSRDRAGQDGAEAVALHLASGSATVLARDAVEPVYSPDGSEIALVKARERVVPRKHRHRKRTGKVVETTTDLFVMNADGTGARRLRQTPGQIELWPSWDPSGQRLAYTRFQQRSLAGALGFGDAVMEINADGTCATTILTSPLLAFYGPAWQPGPGREAGRIEC